MILFLDTISPLPEFSVIEDNKIIYSKKITLNSEEKMSDCIIFTYLFLEKKFSLDKNLKLLIVNTGPGSYTALRVGISFMCGLNISKKTHLIGINCLNLFKYYIEPKYLASSGIFILSSNNQQFIYLYNLSRKSYDLNKIDRNNLSIYNKFSPLKIIFTNKNISPIEKFLRTDIKIEVLNFKKMVEDNLNKIINLPKEEIIKPIYVSNNNILN